MAIAFRFDQQLQIQRGDQQASSHTRIGPQKHVLIASDAPDPRLDVPNAPCQLPSSNGQVQAPSSLAGLASVPSSLAIVLKQQATPVRRRLRYKQPCASSALLPRSTLQAGGQAGEHDFASEYEHLGLDHGAHVDEVKAAYRRRALLDHPDKGGTCEAYMRTHDAYTKLIKHLTSRCNYLINFGARNPESFIRGLLELPQKMWSKRLQEASRGQLSFALQWLSQRSTGLSVEDRQAFSDKRGRCVGKSNVYYVHARGEKLYRVEIIRHSFRCTTSWTKRLEDAIKWQADVLELFCKVDARMRAGASLYEAMEVLHVGCIMRFDGNRTIQGVKVYLPWTFDLQTALDTRREIDSAGPRQAQKLAQRVRKMLKASRIENADPDILALLRQAISGELNNHVEAPTQSLLALSVCGPSTNSAPKRPRRCEQEDEAIQGLRPSPTVAQLQEALDKITWPDCDTRKGVLPDGVLSVSAFAMGLVSSRSDGKPVCSKLLSAWPALTQLATSFVNCYADRKFRYTTIQFNSNYAAALHTDLNNEGPSYIIGLGNYTGGELWIYHPQGNVRVTVQKKIMGAPWAKVGSEIPGILVDIKEKLVSFDGKVPHMVFPFQGTRHSIVWFAMKRWRMMGTADVARLKGCGFRLHPGKVGQSEGHVSKKVIVRKRPAALKGNLSKKPIVRKRPAALKRR